MLCGLPCMHCPENNRQLLLSLPKRRSLVLSSSPFLSPLIKPYYTSDHGTKTTLTHVEAYTTGPHQ